MNISKKQLSLINLLERSGGMLRSELPESKHPRSMIIALIKKGLISEFKRKLTSSTNNV